jgi:hypothetical protein
MFGTAPTITTSLQLNGYLNLGTGAAGSTYRLNIAPTSGATAGSTVFIQDATATTGQTGVLIKAGAVTASSRLLDIQAANATTLFYADTDGKISNFGTFRTNAGGTTNSEFGASYWIAGNGVSIGWAAGTAGGGGTFDTAFRRNAAGIVEVNNGSACSTVANCRDLTLRHLIANGTVPTVANTSANSCGTTAATIVGNDMAGKITVGATAGTSCTITFGTAWPNAPSCHTDDETTANLQRPTSTTTTLIIAGTMVAGDVINYGCVGY